MPGRPGTRDLYRPASKSNSRSGLHFHSTVPGRGLCGRPMVSLKSRTASKQAMSPTDGLKSVNTPPYGLVYDCIVLWLQKSLPKRSMVTWSRCDRSPLLDVSWNWQYEIPSSTVHNLSQMIPPIHTPVLKNNTSQYLTPCSLVYIANDLAKHISFSSQMT